MKQRKKIGLANSKKPNKIYYQSDEVYQFDKELNFINKYPSHRDAAIALGGSETNIGHAVRNEQSYAYDYIWRSKKDVDFCDNDYVPINLRPKFKPKTIYKFDKETGNFICRYESIHAVELDGYKTSTVYNACNKNKALAYGYIWKYEDDVIERDGSFFIAEN